MKVPESASRWLIAATLASLSACATPAGQIGMQPANGSAVPVRLNHAKSWMAAEAQSEDLLYISDYYGVHVFSYPKGVHVGDIYGFVSPAGICSNHAGDVFVTDTPTYHVYEYAHGSTKRLKTLYDNYVDFGPIDCSVDPTTGNVAVASDGDGFVVIFPKAKNRPQVYYDTYAIMFYCTYDRQGNLFVDKVIHRRTNYIGELPKGETQFKNYLLDGRITHSGGIQFDGKHVVIEDQSSHIAYRLRLSGSKAIVLGSTPLNGTQYVDQYWIQGKTLIGPDSNTTVYLWKYPAGGSPVGSIGGFTLNYGSAVSAGP